MKTVTFTTLTMLFAIGLLHRPFVALDLYSSDVGRLISSLTTSTDQVDQNGIVSSFFEILESGSESQDSRMEDILSRIFLLIVLVWLWSKRSVAGASETLNDSRSHQHDSSFGAQ